MLISWKYENENETTYSPKTSRREKKKAKIKRVKNFIKQNLSISNVDLMSIENPEVNWKTNDVIWKIEKIRKTQTKNKHVKSINGNESEKNIEFIIDTIEDHNLRLNAKNKDENVENANAVENVKEDLIKYQTDFIRFENDDEVNSGSDGDVQEQLGYYWKHEVIRVRNFNVDSNFYRWGENWK